MSTMIKEATKEEKIKQLKDNAYSYFVPSKLTCSETLVKVFSDALENPFGESVVKLSSSFAGGIKKGCVCGALAGGSMILGMVYGREYGDEVDNKLTEYTKKIYDDFTDKNKYACCSKLIEGFEMNTPERKQHCVKIVNVAIESIANILIDDNKI